MPITLPNEIQFLYCATQSITVKSIYNSIKCFKFSKSFHFISIKSPFPKNYKIANRPR